MKQINDLKEYVELFGTAPTLAEMPRRTLEEKGIDGPTGAHVIEEMHTPLNFAYVTATTGTTAFQNLVGVMHNEIEERKQVASRIFQMAGVLPSSKVLFTYPPLVSVFSREALDFCQIERTFLLRSERDAFLLALCQENPVAVVGESTFLKSALLDAQKLGLLNQIPRGICFLAAGTPLDLEFLDVAWELVEGQVHDLYGCQEFGFLTFDGVPLRKDITLLEQESGFYDLFVGGLPTGDCFGVSETGHRCNRDGKIITYSRVRQNTECQVIIKKTTVLDRTTVGRLVKTILRTKAKVVLVDQELELNAPATQLVLCSGNGKTQSITGPESTRLFDDLLQAQLDYQARSKSDKVWFKSR